MKLKFYFLFALTTYLFDGVSQVDTIPNGKSLFALDANDITRDQNLVSSLLDRKTTSASQIEQFASEAPATVYVISKEQIESRGYESIVDVLDDLPEVEIQRLSNPEFNQHISFRDVAGNEKFLILQDGVRISAPTGDTHSIGNNFSIEHAEQVEVIIGPASALYGVDAFSGIIQIISNKENKNPLMFKSSYGNNNSSKSLFAYNNKYGELKLSINGMFYHSNEPDLTEAYKEEYKWFNERYSDSGELLISPFFQSPIKVKVDDSRKFNLASNAYFANLSLGIRDFEFSYNRHSDSYSSCVSTKPEYCTYDSNSRFSYFIETIFGKHTYRSRNLKTLLQSIFSFHTYQLQNSTAFVNTYTGYSPGYKMEFGKSKKFEERISYKISKSTKFVGGLIYEILDDLPLTGDLPKPFDFEQPADLQNQYYLGSNIVDKDGNDLSIQQDFFYLHYFNYGAYFQLQTKPNTSINITAGLRYDINTRYGQSINPRLGVVWKPKDVLTIKMLYGESLLSPSPRKSNSHFGSFIPHTNEQDEIIGLRSTFFHLSNLELEPEKLRSIEGSFRYVLSNNLVFSVNGFYTRIDNLINKFAQNKDIDSFKNVPVGFVETAINEGNARIFGASSRIDAVYNLSNGIGFNFYTAYAYTDGNSSGESLLFAAKHQIRTGLEINHRKFSISPRFVFRSISTGNPGLDAENYTGSPAFVICNLYLSYKLFNKKESQVSFFIRVNNLFNKKYYNTFVGGAEGMPLTPQRPLNWRLGLKYSY